MDLVPKVPVNMSKEMRDDMITAMGSKFPKDFGGPTGTIPIPAVAYPMGTPAKVRPITANGGGSNDAGDGSILEHSDRNILFPT